MPDLPASIYGSIGATLVGAIGFLGMSLRGSYEARLKQVMDLLTASFDQTRILEDAKAGLLKVVQDLLVVVQALKESIADLTREREALQRENEALKAALRNLQTQSKGGA